VRAAAVLLGDLAHNEQAKPDAGCVPAGAQLVEAVEDALAQGGEYPLAYPADLTDLA